MRNQLVFSYVFSSGETVPWVPNQRAAVLLKLVYLYFSLLSALIITNALWQYLWKYLTNHQVCFGVSCKVPYLSKEILPSMLYKWMSFVSINLERTGNQVRLYWPYEVMIDLGMILESMDSSESDNCWLNVRYRFRLLWLVVYLVLLPAGISIYMYIVITVYMRDE